MPQDTPQDFFDTSIVAHNKAISKIYSRINNGQSLTTEDEEELGNMFASFCMYG